MEAAVTKIKEEKEEKREKDSINKNRQKWGKPTLEDVSLKIMAQPYIRFT